jgi:4-hydroxy-tetrahydrodipicolinate synthase
MIIIYLGGDPMFGRMITSMITPFDQQNNIHYNSLKHIINHLIKTKTASIILASKTGEGMSLSRLEKQLLIEKTVEYVDERINVLVAIGANSTKETIKEILYLKKYGVDGFVVPVPTYNRPPQEGLYQHFKEIAEATNQPILIEQTRDNHDLAFETIVRLSEIKNIVGIKFNGHYDHMETLHEKCTQFTLYTNDEGLMDQDLKQGAYGVVSQLSHIYGETIHTIIQLINSNQFDHVNLLMELYRDKFNALYYHENPAALKAMLNRLGYLVGHVRLPLVNLNDEATWTLKQNLGL